MHWKHSDHSLAHRKYSINTIIVLLDVVVICAISFLLENLTSLSEQILPKLPGSERKCLSGDGYVTQPQAISFLSSSHNKRFKDGHMVWTQPLRAFSIPVTTRSRMDK